MIIKCDCDSNFQDQKYGKGNRVFNATMKPNIYRCTICTKAKTFLGEKADVKKPKK